MVDMLVSIKLNILRKITPCLVKLNYTQLKNIIKHIYSILSIFMSRCSLDDSLMEKQRNIMPTNSCQGRMALHFK